MVVCLADTDSLKSSGIQESLYDQHLPGNVINMSGLIWEHIQRHQVLGGCRAQGLLNSARDGNRKNKYRLTGNEISVEAEETRQAWMLHDSLSIAEGSREKSINGD